MTWVLAAYLGVGFLAALMVTTDECVAWLRSNPQVRRDEAKLGRWGFLAVLLFAALVMMMIWPVAFMMEDEDDG